MKRSQRNSGVPASAGGGRLVSDDDEVTPVDVVLVVADVSPLEVDAPPVMVVSPSMSESPSRSTHRPEMQRPLLHFASSHGQPAEPFVHDVVGAALHASPPTSAHAMMSACWIRRTVEQATTRS